jgi:diaminopimelate decarboxylase
MNDHETATIEEIKALLEEETPRLLYKELQESVQSYFDKKDTYLAVLKKHPSPLYILETSILKEKAKKFKKAFSSVLPDIACYYAVKSNNYPGIAKTLVQCGYGLEVSSGLELEMALNTSTKSIMFSGPGKTDDELALAVKGYNRVTVLMDSFSELDRLQYIARQHNRIVKTGVRVTTSSQGLWQKFGIPLENLKAFFTTAAYCSNISLNGIQFHTSWNLTSAAQKDFIRKLGEKITCLPEKLKAEISFLDIGGGYWPPQGEWLQPAAIPIGRLEAILGNPPVHYNPHYKKEAAPIETFAEEVASELKNNIFSQISCSICLEPGRWICNDAMHIIVTVIDKKTADLVITDAGTNAVGWERFETDYCPLLNLSQPSLIEKRCYVTGSLCTPHDIWGYSYFGKDIQPGDIIMVPCQGAYTYSLRQNFIKPLPAVVII